MRPRSRRSLVVASFLVSALALTGLLLLRGGHHHIHGLGPPTFDAPPGPSVPGPELASLAQLEVVTEGLDQPVGFVTAPGDQGAAYLALKRGRIARLDLGTGRVVFVAELSARVSQGAEQGLLGLAFHPRYPLDPRLFVNLTSPRGDTQILELRRGPDGRIDGARARVLLEVAQPFANHNGGHLTVGPDGALWIGLGDGGSAGDPQGNGQRDGTLLGKMVRLSLDGPPTAVPHMRGLRNPWRYAFDRGTGDLWIADVGQDAWEEINYVPAEAALRGGQNFGWNAMEGATCFKRPCDPRSFVAPVATYDHRTGCAITGGVVYRGAALPALRGRYFYSDFCSGILRSLRLEGGRVTEALDWKAAVDPDKRLRMIVAFGEDEAGELYLVSLGGTIFKLIPRPAPPR